MLSLINDMKEVNLIWSPLHENLENFLFTGANAHNKNIKSHLSGPHGQTNTKDDFLTKINHGLPMDSNCMLYAGWRCSCFKNFVRKMQC